MTIPPFRAKRPIDQFADWVNERLDRMEGNLMESSAQLQASLDSLTASFTDFSSDVTATLQHNQQTLARMQATLDAAVADGTASRETITALRAQVATLEAGNNLAIARVTALNDAVKAEDVAVDQPVPPSS